MLGLIIGRRTFILRGEIVKQPKKLKEPDNGNRTRSTSNSSANGKGPGSHKAASRQPDKNQKHKSVLVEA